MTPPAATAAGRTVRRSPAPRVPRRVSGPAQPARPPRSGATPRRTADPVIVRAARRGRNVADSRFLDRLVRGRLWIPVVAAALMGIVFMQVSMLKLNSSIGRAVQSASTLERQNQGLRADVSRMESGERIQSVARKLGMVVPTAGGFHYLQPGDATAAARAAEEMTAPGSEAVLRSKAIEQAAAAGTTPGTATAAATGTTAATAPGVTGTPSTAPSTGATAAPPSTGTAATAVTPGQGSAPATSGTQAGTATGTTAAGGTGAPAVQQQSPAPAGGTAPGTTSAPAAAPAAVAGGGMAAPAGGNG